jgi:gamma-glutamylcyclotransferase (GGCT)/AIG2-like uncharacterized protein YtfP
MNLFAYGTLMWPHVLEAVIGRHLSGAPAVLEGYLRRRVKGECFPAVIASSGSCVAGILYCGLTAEEFEQLDRFEGEEYVRRSEPINGCEVQVYVLSERWNHLAEPDAWVPEDLDPIQLDAFCREYKGWRAT